jgi:transposase
VQRRTTAPGGPAGTVQYIYGLDGELLAEDDAATGRTLRDYIWLPQGDISPAADNDNEEGASPLPLDMGISPCIPSRIGRKVPIPHDADLYRLRHKIENMFARLKDWRRIATRYDRCPILFLSACALAATVIYWL